jgi:hypothetical protein
VAGVGVPVALARHARVGCAEVPGLPGAAVEERAALVAVHPARVVLALASHRLNEQKEIFNVKIKKLSFINVKI